MQQWPGIWNNGIKVLTMPYWTHLKWSLFWLRHNGASSYRHVALTLVYLFVSKHCQIVNCKINAYLDAIMLYSNCCFEVLSYSYHALFYADVMWSRKCKRISIGTQSVWCSGGKWSIMLPSQGLKYMRNWAAERKYDSCAHVWHLASNYAFGIRHTDIYGHVRGMQSVIATACGTNQTLYVRRNMRCAENNNGGTRRSNERIELPIENEWTFGGTYIPRNSVSVHCNIVAKHSSGSWEYSCVKWFLCDWE